MHKFMIFTRAFTAHACGSCNKKKYSLMTNEKIIASDVMALNFIFGKMFEIK